MEYKELIKEMFLTIFGYIFAWVVVFWIFGAFKKKK